MDERSYETGASAADAARARALQRAAFAAALLAVPLLGVLVNAPLREEVVMHVGLLADEAGEGRPAPDASVFADRRASAVPDHALLDANDVRRALPATPQTVSGLENAVL